jgi:non-specific serine/threonine protein kinase
VEAVHPRASAAPSRPLLGRDRELADIQRLVLDENARLVTLSGPGGVGKTRLALAAANVLEPAFADGWRFVDLAPLSDPSLVLSAIGRACGLLHDNPHAPLPPLARALRDRELLLVIDNFEHVIDAAIEVGQLVEACPALRVIVTSREPLRLRAEHEFPIQPLPLPIIPSAPELGRDELETVAQNPSVALFVQRARAVRPTFALAPDNARALAEVCVRLDGLPLAIELAAARVRFVPATALGARLDRPLDLQSGLRDAPERHRTLRDAIAWSYGLLSPEHQTIFTRMAVFAGGCSLEAAQAVCGPADVTPDRVFEVLAELVERNLLLSDDAVDGDVRFRLLETVREFASEQLDASGHADAARRAHAAYFAELAAHAVHQLLGREQRKWLDVLARDLDNLRAALSSLIRRGEPESIREAAVLNWRLWPFWWARGYLSEARRWSNTIATHPAAAPVDRARAAWVASTAALDEGDYAAAPALVAECMGVFRELDDAQGLGRALLVDGWAAPIEGDVQRAIESHQASIEQFQRAGDQAGVILALAGLANTATLMGDLDAATRYNKDALALADRVRDTHSQAQVLEAMGLIALQRGDLPAAAQTFKRSIPLCLEVGSLELVCYCLVGLAGVAAAESALARSAQLLGAAAGLRERAGLGVWPVRRDLEEVLERKVREAFGQLQEVLQASWTAGRNLSLRAAAQLATDDAHAHEQLPVESGPLTARELEVAALIAQGKTSKEIAEQLVITERTADTHAAHIRDKLGLRSRAEIAAWAIRNRVDTPGL